MSVSGQILSPRNCRPPSLLMLFLLVVTFSLGSTEAVRSADVEPMLALNRDRYHSGVPRLGAGATGPRRSLWEAKTGLRFRRLKRQREGDCWSSAEQHLFYKHFPMSPELERALEGYMEMHQRCTEVEDWHSFPSTLAWGKDGERGKLRGCQYLFFTPPPGHGLGNRIMALVSVFTVALLTNRAILMRSDIPTATFLCNPFKRSSWALNGSMWRDVTGQLWRSTRLLRHMEGNIWDGWEKKMLHVSISWNTEEAARRFFCPETHDRVLHWIPVLSMESDQFFVPGLYFVPEFEDKLRRWLPDGRAFLHLGRFLVHPRNRIWLRVTRYYETYLARHTRLVGVQVRTFPHPGGYIPVDQRVLDCARNVSGFLPPTIPLEEYADAVESGEMHPLQVAAGGRVALARSRGSLGVFVASLNQSFADSFAGLYGADEVPADGQLVGVYSLTHDGWERKDAAQYENALVEMLLLSFCDQLLTTDYSTFGYVAAGLSGAPTVSMNIIVKGHASWQTNGRPVCQRVTSEPCFHRFPSKKLKCKGQSEWVTAYHPDVGLCDAIGTGLMLKSIKAASS